MRRVLNPSSGREEVRSDWAMTGSIAQARPGFWSKPWITFTSAPRDSVSRMSGGVDGFRASH